MHYEPLFIWQAMLVYVFIDPIYIVTLFTNCLWAVYKQSNTRYKNKQYKIQIKIEIITIGT